MKRFLSNAQGEDTLEARLKNTPIDLITPFKNLADYAINEYGANSDIAKALFKEVENLENRHITIRQAIEKRKDINQIIRNYNDNPNTLKKFRIQEGANDLKEAIDIQIHNAIESGIAKGELKQSAREALDEFKNANAAYADIKNRLNDKLTKAVFMDKPKKSTMNSMRSVEEWKKAVLDKAWADSIQGLENTIFAKFNPKMQEHTQTLLIFRSIERHIKEKEGQGFIDLSKALKDIKDLEKLPLHPNAQKALEIFKEYAKTYEFLNKLSGAKGFKSGAGNGALATTLEGRARVFLANRVFKKLFFRVPYIGDKDALLHHLKKAVQDLKYPRTITLDMLQNPNATKTNPPSPSNPKGEPYINESLKRDMLEFATNEQILKDELTHRAKQWGKQNAITPPNTEEIKKAIENNELIYSTIGNGKLEKEDLKLIGKALDLSHKGLSTLQAMPTPKQISTQELQEILSRFDNVENLMTHLNTRKDEREAIFNLLDLTMAQPQVKFTKDAKDKYIKRFVDDTNKSDPYFYLLVTKDKDKIFITHFKTRDVEYLERQIQQADSVEIGADIIGDLRQQAGGAKHKSPTSEANSTSKLYKMQDTKIESVGDLSKYADMLGLRFKDESEARAVYEALNKRRSEIEC